MHEAVRYSRFVGVVLGQGKGGAGDRRSADPEALGQALHQGCFAGAEGSRSTAG